LGRVISLDTCMCAGYTTWAMTFRDP